MQIAKIELFELRLPLKREIKHASATRHDSTNILIRCRLSNGVEGWGEGVPRVYVTGESIDGAVAQFDESSLADSLAADCESWHDVVAMCEAVTLARMTDDPRGCYGNALRCAVELSVLDAFGRELGEPLQAVTQHFRPAAAVVDYRDAVRYSGAITAETARKEWISTLKMRAYGFAQCKIKVGMAGTNDAERLGRIRRWIGGGVDLRLDANEAWPIEHAVSKIEPLLAPNVTCIEQPVKHEEVEGLAEVRRRLDIPFMLDESLTSMVDAASAIEHQTCDIFNIRLSKCGGFLNSLRLASLARESGLGFQLGCHPGESGVLSAAGRHWACSVGGIRYLEGSYDRHLLRRLLTNEDITFRYGGRARSLPGAGLGVTVNPEALKALATRRTSQSL